MRRIGLALAIAASVAGCSWLPHASKEEPKDAGKVDFAAGQKDFATAVTLFQNRRCDQAARLCEKLVQDRPYFAPAQLLLARSYHAEGKDDSAIPRYRALLNLSPNHAEGLSELAAIHRSRGESALAASLLDRAFDRARDRDDLATALAEAWDEAGQPEKGLEVRLAHLKAHPACVPTAKAAIQWLLDRGEAVRAREVVGEAVRAGARVEDLPGIPEEAGPQVEQPLPEPPDEQVATAKDPAPTEPPAEADTTSTVGAALVAASEPRAVPPTEPPSAPEPPSTSEPPSTPEPPASEPDPPAERATRLSPEARAWFEEGDRSMAEGLAADAIEAFRRSRDHGGPEAMLSVRLARAEEERTAAQIAARDLTQQLGTTKDPVALRVKLATAWLADGQPLPAQLLLAQATVMGPDCGEAFYLLGLACERRGQWQPAAEAFERARSLCSGSALEVQAGFHLEEIAAHLDH